MRRLFHFSGGSAWRRLLPSTVLGSSRIASLYVRFRFIEFPIALVFTAAFASLIFFNYIVQTTFLLVLRTLFGYSMGRGRRCEPRKGLKNLERERGFEPPTFCLRTI